MNLGDTCASVRLPCPSAWPHTSGPNCQIHNPVALQLAFSRPPGPWSLGSALAPYDPSQVLSQPQWPADKEGKSPCLPLGPSPLTSPFLFVLGAGPPVEAAVQGNGPCWGPSRTSARAGAPRIGHGASPHVQLSQGCCLSALLTSAHAILA